MRTGGDDIAQALALMGVQPALGRRRSRRVTGFEILPLAVLDRPRVDVTLRVSGFFRDAFPGQIDLFDSAVRAVAALDEPEDAEPAGRARSRRDARRWSRPALRRGRGRAAAPASASSARKPGAYGAGLQALIDEKRLARRRPISRRAYLAWGGYAYGDGADGRGGARRCSRRGWRRSRRCCTTRTTASTTCSTATTTTSSRAGSRRRCSI